MSTTSPPIAPDVLTGLRQGDEGALERVFRDHYEALTAEAMAVLHDAGLAAITVERVFLRVWKDREKYQTPDELSAFLHQCTHESAVQKQARRAGLAHLSGG